jgi:small subunit ribosomal protein S6e
MPFKINLSHKGKTFQIETESEALVGKKISETIKGEDISPDLKGYELEITGISDIAGLPGFKGLEGTAYHRRLLTRGPGMHDTTKGLRLRKTNRGEEISLKISQINTKVLKQGNKKFEELLPKKEEKAEAKEEEVKTEKAVEEKKEEKA